MLSSSPLLLASSIICFHSITGADVDRSQSDARNDHAVGDWYCHLRALATDIRQSCTVFSSCIYTTLLTRRRRCTQVSFGTWNNRRSRRNGKSTLRCNGRWKRNIGKYKMLAMEAGDEAIAVYQNGFPNSYGAMGSSICVQLATIATGRVSWRWARDSFHGLAAEQALGAVATSPSPWIIWPSPSCLRRLYAEAPRTTVYDASPSRRYGRPSKVYNLQNATVVEHTTLSSRC